MNCGFNETRLKAAQTGFKTKSISEIHSLKFMISNDGFNAGIRNIN